MKKIVLILMVGMFLSVSFGQSQSKIGLGFEFHTFPSSFMMQDMGPSLGIYIPIETTSFLMEPLIMYSSLETEIDYDDYILDDSKYTESDLTLLIGILKPTVRGKIRSYFGIRLGKQFTEKDYDNNDLDEENEYLIIAPTIGAEYYISDNFSFGGEGMYSMVFKEEEGEEYASSNGGGVTIISKQHMLIPRFIVRFYF